MSQLITCKSPHGIILATDSKAIDFNIRGDLMESNVHRLLQLSPNAAIMTGGAAEGARMCRTLKDFVRDEGLYDLEDVYGAALPFLASEFDRFMRKHCEVFPLDPVHQVHFILAGYTQKEKENPFRQYLIWTKKKLPQLDGDEITLAFSIPRIMRLEYKLNQLAKERERLERILPEIQNVLETQAETQGEIGGPFSYAFITKEGFKRVS